MVLEQFLTLFDASCIFWRQLADDGFDFLEMFGVEQSCIYPCAPSCQHRLRGKGNFRTDLFPDNDAAEGAFTKILFMVETRSLTSGNISRTDSQTRWRPWSRQVKECGVEDLQFLA